MKRVLAVLIVIAAMLVGFGGVAAAQTEESVRMKIPFAFYAGDQLLPAGQYSFEMPRMSGFAAGTMLRITAQDNSVCKYLLAQRIDGVTTDTDFYVAFNKYGDKYFLANVRNSYYGAMPARSRLEKTVRAEAAKISAVAMTTIDLRGVVSRAK